MRKKERGQRRKREAMVPVLKKMEPAQRLFALGSGVISGESPSQAGGEPNRRNAGFFHD
jgi:hypothetical protein